MAGNDLSARFETICDKAKTVTDKLNAAGQRTGEQLETDAANARQKANAAADQLTNQAAAGHAKASSQWQEIRGNWQAHVARVRTRVDKRHTNSRRTMPR